MSILGKGTEKPAFSDIANANSAIAHLGKDLHQAKNRFENGTNGGREGVIAALSAVFQFVHLLPTVDEDKLHAPLGALLNALKSLDNGKVLPLLSPTPVTNRPPDSEFRNDMKGAVAFTVTRLRTTGLEARPARAAVVSVLIKEKVLANGKTPTHHTIRNWCQEVSEDRHSDAARTFDELNAIMPDKKGGDPSALRRAYLDMLRTHIRRTRGRDV